MLQTFQDHYRDAIETEGESEWHFWLGVVSDEGQSLVREHVAALRERILLMKKIFLVPVVIGIVVLFTLLNMTFHIIRPLMELSGYAVIVGVLALMARLAGTFPRPEVRLTWLQLGLVMGVALSLYDLAQKTIGVFLPTFPQFYDFNANLLGDLSFISTVLLIGTVGLIGGYSSGSIRVGIFAGLLTGIVNIVVSNIGQALLIVLLWHSIQHGTLHSQLASDYQDMLRNWLQPPSLWNFMNREMLDNGLVINLVFPVIGLTIEGLFAWAGAAFGVAANRRAGDVPRQEALANRVSGLLAWLLGTPSGLILTLLLFNLLTWGLYAQMVFRSEQGSYLFSLQKVGNSFISPGFALWLLGFLVVLAAVLVVAWPRSINREGGRSYS
jgi:hypothetical protein